MFGKDRQAIERWFDSDGQTFLRRLGLSEEQHVLDFGCGLGSITVPAAHVVGPDGLVLALDVNKAQLKTIARRVEGTDLAQRIRFIHTSGEPRFPDTPDAGMDAVFVFDVLQHIKDWNTLFAECRRALKGTGRLHINASEISHPEKVDVGRMQALLTDFGFEEIHTIRTRLMHYKHMADDLVRSYGKTVKTGK